MLIFTSISKSQHILTQLNYDARDILIISNNFFLQSPRGMCKCKQTNAHVDTIPLTNPAPTLTHMYPT